MRNLVILALAVAALVMVSGCEDGSYWDADTKQIKADAVSRIEATGVDLRVYEFTSQVDDSIQCIYVAGDSKAGLQCFSKAK